MKTPIKLGLLAIGGLMLMAPNRRAFDHIGNFNFKVEIEGVTQGAFAEVSGLSSTTDVIEFQDGQDIVLRKRPGRTRYGNITLKRGYTNNTELWNWRKAVIDGQVERKAGSIILSDDRGGEIMRYNFFEAWPTTWKGFALDGEGKDVTVEEITIAVEKIERG